MNPKRKLARIEPPKDVIRVESFQAVSFFDPEHKRQVIVLYSLGADGIVREYSNGKWTPFPIT